MATTSFAVHERSTKVTVLKGISIICESKGCEQAARFLFRTGSGPISAACRCHAREKAMHMALWLPEDIDQAMSASD